jgi:hypothetical protein
MKTSSGAKLAYQTVQTRKVGAGLIVGIALVPLLFAWLTLRPGYSAITRLAAFGWLAFLLSYAFIQARQQLPAKPTGPGATTEAITKAVPTAKEAVTKKPNPPKAIALITATPAPQQSLSWQYTHDEDQMRNVATDTATIQSVNTLDLGFPYDSNPGFLSVAHTAANTFHPFIVELKVDGQFDLTVCDGPYGCDLIIKFDDGPIRHFIFHEADGHPAGILIAYDDPELVPAIRSASKMWIEATYFQNGRRQLEFDVQGLHLP